MVNDGMQQEIFTSRKDDILTDSEALVSSQLTFYLVRHGRTILNALERVQGWSDAVLTPAGERVVNAAGIGLKDIDFQGVYSSDSGRAVRTAEIIIKHNTFSAHREVIADPRFREYSFGSYEGEHSLVMQQDVAENLGLVLTDFLKTRTSKSVVEALAQLDKTRRTPDAQQWPAEDYASYTHRLLSGLKEVALKEKEASGSGNILVVSHGVSIDTVLSTLSGDPHIALPEGIQNASVSTVEYSNNQYYVKSVNDTSHIEAGKAVQI